MMERENYYLGIDLGTSSVKAIAKTASGKTQKAKETYGGNEPCAWLAAMKAVIREIRDASDGRIAAIAFSSQVGTYIVNSTEVLSWQASIGGEELAKIRSKISEEEFLREIGMKHPDLISYPLPRYAYIQKHYGPDAEVLMPKELLIRALTGETVSDVFSMRGVAHPDKLCYATSILQKLGINLKLPRLTTPTALAGRVTEAAAKAYGLECGIPVYLGCNDFFAGLLGMGIYNLHDSFDLSGTSEHVGYISERINEKGFVSGGYFTGNCTYGGTKSSGASCALAMREFGIDGLQMEEILAKKPPIFLPYLSGERAPIFDESARGVYFGLHDKTDRQALAFSALEGVVFSLYDIASSMEMPKPKRLICGGGSAQNALMNRLRATLFDCEVVSVCENDTSALGACMLAMVGDGVYRDIPAAIRACVRYQPSVQPSPAYREQLQKRFSVYQALYGDLKERFQEFQNI